ncbi:ovarian cancer G-protein coupled receptor 1-like [Micropterus dolomieu]|uniref:ovarian cancer G-protein coupled receptor 1-like n=1 Tax=Micropterus dolomieu TaxID=147949 RepID=UPI001E8DA1AC|nr:ovarian cancer G-protein coupled receptor 1-like [Micropterus dolomieu]
MEGLHMDNTSQNQSYDHSDITSNNQDYRNLSFILYVVTYTIIATGLPLTLVAIYALYSMVRRDHVAPIYVINLLITDLIQLCFMIVQVVRNVDWTIYLIFVYIYFSALIASVGFMVCIALERYLVIAHPLWYRFRRSIRSSVVVSVLVWVLSVVCVVLFFNLVRAIIYFVLLLSFPLLIFSLVGTLKALSASISVPSDEKRRIVGILVLVLFIYTVLFLPFMIWFLKVYTENNRWQDLRLNILSLTFLRFSPLADLFLYVFMRKGFIDKLLASVCCCRMDSNDISSSSV